VKRTVANTVSVVTKKVKRKKKCYYSNNIKAMKTRANIKGKVFQQAAKETVIRYVAILAA